MKKLCLFSLFTLAGISPHAVGDIWTEREALMAIEQEIKALNILVEDAKKYRDKKNRTQFDYQVLLDDLQKIRQGISSHLIAPMEPVVPSKIDALKTNYTERQQ